MNALKDKHHTKNALFLKIVKSKIGGRFFFSASLAFSTFSLPAWLGIL